MSSGENIEIGIGADSSGLVEALERVAQNLQSLEKALGGVAADFETAGKKAEKAMKDTEKSTDKAANSVDKLNDKAEQTANTYDSIADQAGRADSALSGLAAVIDHVNPEMAELTRLAADVAGGMEQVILAVRQAPLMVGVVAGLTAVWAAGTHSMREESERFEQANEDLSDSYDRLINLINRGRQLQDDYTRSLQLSLGFTDQITARLEDRLRVEEQIFNNAVQQARRRRQIAREEAENAAASLRELAERQALTTSTMIMFSASAQEQSSQTLAQSEELLAQAAAEANEEYEESIRVAQEARQENIRLAETERNLARAIRDRTLALNHLSAASLDAQLSQEQSFSFWGSSESQRMATTIVDVNGTLVTLQDGIRATSSEFEMLEQQFISSNDAFTSGEGSIERQAELVQELNELLGHEDDRYRALTDNVVGQERAHGALNLVTREAINVHELFAEVLSLRNERAIEAAEATSELADATEEDSIATEENIRLQREFLRSLNEANAALSESFESEGIQRIEEYRDAVAAVEAEAVKLGLSLDHAEVVERLSGLLKELNVDLDEINSIEVDDDPFLGPLESALRAQEALQEQRMFLRAMEEEDALLRQQYLTEAELQRKENHDAQAERLADMEQIIADHHQEISDMEAEAAEARAERLQDVFDENIQGIGGLAGALSDVFEERADGLGEDNMAQAQQAFEISKALAIAEITVNTAAAIMSVVSQAKSVTGAAARAVAIGALAAVQMAQVKKQELSFHSGGIVPESDPSETSARLLPGEAVLNRSAVSMLGQSGVSQINSGMMPGSSSQLVAVETYKHFDRFVGDEYRRQGTLFNLFRKNSEGTFGQRGY